MKKRRLREEDLELWQRVARSTERMHPEAKPPKVEGKTPAPKRPDPQPVAQPGLKPFRLGQKSSATGPSHDLLPALPDRLGRAAVQMDRKAHTKLKRGKLLPEARIDLHGMTMARAHPALIGFILRSHHEGRRLVLVITGKGKDRDEDGPIPVPRGVLRHQVPHWLQMPPLSALVMQVSEAHLKHGGGGAYYVYLRKNRG
ncbi:Smr/MutS family protein [Pseudooceanicola sp. 502str34]|uniref:Smr/MutS family protein n=1 Tax=Maritimibacter alkaliphilus TaxID=404236 RepID=UPI001C95CB90|nr:Smr/MutS family protein [Maritimibacter alkaliphilus]MBY6090512.1 Smr/MutS family protein [Maritimibacter alkaliphilus]